MAQNTIVLTIGNPQTVPIAVGNPHIAFVETSGTSLLSRLKSLEVSFATSSA